MMRFFSIAAVFLAMGSFANNVLAAQSNIEADSLTRDAYGVVTAQGNVELTRQGQTLQAPVVVYDVPNNHLRAQGGVHLSDVDKTMTSDTLQRDASGTTTASGDVQLQQKEQTLTADQVVYHENSGRVEATGHVLIDNGEATLSAKQAEQDASGVIRTKGNVLVKRQQETLQSDSVSYDRYSKVMEAQGHVHLESAQASIDADSMKLHTVNPTGELNQVQMRLPGGERVQAEHIHRLNTRLFDARQVSLTTCPVDEQAWRLYADQATIDQQEGSITAKGVRFEMGGLPLLYTPYGKYPLRRSSGLLIPFAGSSKSRGTEFALPVYLAPASNWDATLTPRWMTARGFLSQLELRHASAIGREMIDGSYINDKNTGTTRYHLNGNMAYQLPSNWTFLASGNHVSDHQYVADLAPNRENAKVAYLQSDGRLQWQDGLNFASLSVQHNQDLRLINDKTTLQILPRLESGVVLPLNFANLHLDQQSSGFDRKVGTDGWRFALHPWLERDVEWFDGSVRANVRGGMHHLRYQQLNTAQRQMHMNVFDGSVEMRVEMEKVNEHATLRHALTPVLRYDRASAPDQRLLPNFDSSFGQLSMQNLMSGNRFNGYDRFERMNRLSFLLENSLQYKGDDEQAHTWLSSRVGVAYDMLRESIDPTLSTTVTRPFSNLLGDITVTPLRGIRLTAAGLYDPVDHYWPTASSAMALQHDDGHALNLSWQRTDKRYAAKTETVNSQASVQLSSRWQMLGAVQYDAVEKLTQQASAGIHYQHACWDFLLTGYRTHLSGTAGKSDVGFSFLLGFKGLGSVGN